ncbi:MAG: hypothetical protein R3B09_06155 [Nannocystaceae bacterium]
MPAADDPPAPGRRPLARLRGLARRWFLAYALLTMLPFPLDALPGLEGLVRALSAPWDAIVAWTGAHLLGVEAVPRWNGSGDTLYHHVSHLCVVALSLAAAIVWTWRAGPTAPSGRVVDRTRAYARLYVGGRLLVYGWLKVFPSQFPEPGPDRLLVPFGDMSPMAVLWTFMGAGAGYQRLAGVAEVVGALLLFARRTTTLGALLLTFVLANVVALNLVYDVPVKLHALRLLGLTLFILAPDGRRLVDVLWYNRAAPPRPLDPYPIPGRWRRRLALLGKWGLLVALHLAPFRQIARRGEPTPLDPFHGVYDVISFDAADPPAGPPVRRWLRVGINRSGRGAIQWTDGEGEHFRVRYDPTRRDFSWATMDERGEPDDLRLHLDRDDDGTLRLSGRLHGVSTALVLRRRRDPPRPLALTRGLHWVQERPFNR